MAAAKLLISETPPSPRRFGRFVLGRLGLAMAWAVIALPAWACDTPVYRYAMYRWMPAPYEVYYFHRGQPAKADEAVNALFAEDSKSTSVANVIFTAVDLARKDALDALPGPVKKAWQARANTPLPAYAIWTPWGEEVFAGKLDAAAARAMIESPLRSQIAKLLDQGHGIVLLVVNGSDAKENARVESATKQVIAKAASGEIGADPSTPPPEPGQKASGDGDAAPKPPALRLAFEKLDRTNANERWLLRMLMAMEPGLEKHAAEPMLFAVYGRGRVMPPGIGKEVTAETLFSLVSFLAGQCSCTVKDQNPGLDLLVKWDWEATAEKFAQEDEAFVKSQPLYREVAADGPEMTPAPDASSKETAPGGVATPKKAGEPPKAAGAQKSSVAGSTPPALPPSPAAPEVKHDSPGQSPMAGQVFAPTPGDRPTESFVARQAWGIGLGLAAMAAVVVAAGFLLVRKRNHDSP